MIRTQEVFAWRAGNVLFGTQELFCVEQRKCLAWNTRNALFGAHEISCLEHKKGAQEISCLEHMKYVLGGGNVTKGVNYHRL